MNTYTAEQIIRIGGSEWRKGGKHRVYINTAVWKKLIGLETSHYNSGNIASATLDGERISNSHARDILSCIDSVYWDAADGQIHIWTRRSRCSSEVSDLIRAGIAQAVADSEPKTDDTDDTDDDTTTPATPNPVAQVAALRSAGRTVREIAEMIGCAVSTIYRWARGICRPSARYAARLAAIAA